MKKIKIFEAQLPVIALLGLAMCFCWTSTSFADNRLPTPEEQAGIDARAAAAALANAQATQNAANSSLNNANQSLSAANQALADAQSALNAFSQQHPTSPGWNGLMDPALDASDPRNETRLQTEQERANLQNAVAQAQADRDAHQAEANSAQAQANEANAAVQSANTDFQQANWVTTQMGNQPIGNPLAADPNAGGVNPGERYRYAIWEGGDPSEGGHFRYGISGIGLIPEEGEESNNNAPNQPNSTRHSQSSRENGEEQTRTRSLEVGLGSGAPPQEEPVQEPSDTPAVASAPPSDQNIIDPNPPSAEVAVAPAQDPPIVEAVPEPETAVGGPIPVQGAATHFNFVPGNRKDR